MNTPPSLHYGSDPSAALDDKVQFSSPTSTAAACMASPSFGCILADVSEKSGRNSSVGSSDLEEIGAPVQQLPPPEMGHFAQDERGSDVAMTSPEGGNLLSFDGSLSPRQQSGKRYYGGYLLHRVPKAAGLLKSWKRRYFRLRDHGLVCYKTQEAAEPLFQVNFTVQSMLVQETVKGDDNSREQEQTQARTSRHSRTGSSSGSLGLTIKGIEILGRKIPVKSTDVFLKAEDEAEHAAWMECVRFTIGAFKRKQSQTSVDKNDDENDEMTPSTLTSPVGSDAAVGPGLEAMVNHLEKVEDFSAFRSKYLLMKEIGEGSFSIVHRAVNRLTGRLCAVKCCKISAALEEEERLLRTLSHPNVVGLEGVYARDKTLHYVVMDYLKDGDLCDLLISRQRLSEIETRRIIRQVAEGLAYLHKHCVLHRDIKPENILIHGNIVKIADFGLAKQLEHSSTMLKRSCGTLEYAAPELLCGRPYGLKSDIFSLGVVMYVLLFGAFPFSVQSAAALQSMEHFPTGVDVRDMSCLSRTNVQWRTVSPLAQDVLLKMLMAHENERISAADLLEHAWFDQINDTSEPAIISPEKYEIARTEDCEAMGFAELLSRGLKVVKYGYKESTKPHTCTLTLNFLEESISWTGRKIPMLPRAASRGSDKGAADNTKRGRSILLREIQDIREGHTTNAFKLLPRNGSTHLPPPERCLSIICSWRTLDIVLEAPNQRDFMSAAIAFVNSLVDSEAIETFITHVCLWKTVALEKLKTEKKLMQIFAKF
ncbi:hypothetical protein PHYBOEH_009613 [Phytophthora boehmeriae]|uniref:CAMK/CAMK2 protein kinase n=1 Tax=Phytophthora boehmeriae TaxID=109152 RepID=A0A8T1X522_9STRA|nr:hypothetical protein PHYBOEH_009613 [Phytophthora boehmeriae]